MPRLDRERERERERDSDGRRAKDSYGPPPKKPTMNEYFVDGEGIEREVLQSELCKFLGTDATSRPAEYNGIKGYKIKALRPFTSEMLVDLKELSKSYQLENRRHPGDLSWDDSDTFRQWSHSGPPPPSGPGSAPYPGPMAHQYSGSDMPPNNYPPQGYLGGQQGGHQGGPPHQGGHQGGHPGGHQGGHQGPGQGGFPAYGSTMPPGMSGMPAPSMDNYGRDSSHYRVGGQPPADYPPNGYFPSSAAYGNEPRMSRDQPIPPGYQGYAGPSQEPRGGYQGGYPPDQSMRGMQGPPNPYDMPRPPNGSPYGGPVGGDGPPAGYRQGPNPFGRGGRGHP